MIKGIMSAIEKYKKFFSKIWGGGGVSKGITPLNTYRNIYEYIKSDYQRYGGEATFFKIILNGLFGRNHCFAFSFWLRLSSVKNVFYIPARIMHRKYMKKYDLQIYPATKIGYGLYIGHGIGIVINNTVKIGNNCNLSQFTTIRNKS